ncbi:MAG TPA: carboxypeptidase-like regulatory domain-containing protein, partial [Acidimicrobiales bacterium]|nr:carboxypeptidase-like regulatory domain-containing protein [Acidimicrobiales bacterium]
APADAGAAEMVADAGGDGGFTLSGLRAGNHFVGFVDPSGAHASRFWPDSPNVRDATPVAVTAADATTADVVLPAQFPTGTGATIAGTVTESGTGDPVGSARVVALRASDFAMVRGATADNAGQYSLDVVPGDYKLAVLDGAGRHGMEWFDDQPNTGLGDASTVTAPRSGVDAALAPTTGAVAGTVTDDPSGEPLGGVWVVAIGPSGIAGGAVTGADGTYTVDWLVPGTYRVAFADPNGGRAQEYWDDSPDYPGATPFAVTAGATVTVAAALALP